VTLRAAGVVVPLALGALVAPLSSGAQPAGKVARVGLLCVANCPAPLRSRLATIAPFPSYAPAGALMTYGPDVAALGRRAAAAVVRILQGTPPADIPVEEPSRYHLAINLVTAKALGLTIPPSVLARADEVIQR
jgi:hypothetical protein